jgi:hypothetical protein
VGCHHGLSDDPGVLRCYFSDTGFPLEDGRRMRPCHSAYHTSCLSVGPPFVSRRKNHAGLCFPDVTEWGTFICEACTVRSVACRELSDRTDGELLALERMRLLDMAHHWSLGTHTSYQGKLRTVRKFEERYDVHILLSTPLVRPPHGVDIPLMWCQEAYGLRLSTAKRSEGTDMNLAFSTIRQLRSAVSQFLAWDLMISKPQQAYMDHQRRVLEQPCRATDGLGYTLYSAGMRARVGDQSHPSLALLDCHVRSLDLELNRAYLETHRPAVRHQLALAGLANLALWLGWLRSSETFGLTWADLVVIEPEDSGTVDLPPGCGMVSCRLAPETKSARSHRPDVPMAYKSLSGYHIGKWFHRARHSSGLGANWGQCTSPIFVTQAGTPWTSKFFRRKYLYPSLHRQRAAGDPYLRPFDGSPGNTIESKMWSLHCYRRGARSHVSRGGKFGKHRLRRASKDEVYEHGRWRRRRSGEAIDKIYQAWPIRDRIKLTLCCM